LRKPALVGATILIADVVVLLGALFVSSRAWLWWRPHLEHLIQVQWLDLLGPNEWMPPGLLLVAAWVLFLRHLGFYDPSRMSTVIRELGALSRSLLYLLILVVTIQFFVPERYYSRSLIVLFLGATFTGLATWRWALLVVQGRRPMDFAAERVAIVGTAEDARIMAERLERYGRFALAGFIAPRGERGDLAQPRRRAADRDHAPVVPEDQILGEVGDMRDLVNQYDVHTVVLASRILLRDEALKLATHCDQMGLRVLQVPFTWGVASPKLRFAELGELQLVDLSNLSYPSLVEHFKRGFDLLATSLALVALSPVFLATALGVWLDDPGPVFFTAPRAGKGGRAFPFIKFRSMVVGADRMKEDLRDKNETDGVLFKIRNDPRITRIGHFIRKYSVDELPQLWNVMRGDMNLVGPRPLPMRDLEGIENDPEIAYWFELRHKVSPGITGLWQVSGRSDLGFRAMVDLDIYYIQNWSLWLDLKILLMTIPAVLRGRGAA